MKELEFIEIIKKSLRRNSHIGDDCAFLEAYNLVITQDTLVEDVHFSMKYFSPYQLAYKAIMVNLSDIFASGAMPDSALISLSLPSNTDTQFIEEFYKACNDLSERFGFEVIGGDITGAEKIYISVCFLGSTTNRNISSRKNAKVGDLVLTTGIHGSSAAGFYLLQNNVSGFEMLKNAHLMPLAQEKFSKEISTKLIAPYAMMDSSDGLCDALFKIASASSVSISVDFSKISYDKNIEAAAKLANVDYKDWILNGGEDYQLIACVGENDLALLDDNLFQIIGRVQPYSPDYFVEFSLQDKVLKVNNLESSFNHFKQEER